MKFLQLLTLCGISLALSIFVFSAEMEESRPFMILRQSGTNDINMLKAILESSKKADNPWDETWFHINHFWDTDRILKHCKEINSIKEDYKTCGMKVSFQGLTLGHHGSFRPTLFGDTPDNPNGIGKLTESDLMIGEKGEKIPRLCPNSQNARRFAYERAKLFIKQISPSSFWLDDDLRVAGGDSETFACFCDTCLEKFSKFVDKKYSRNELVKHLAKNIATREPIRKQWVEFCAQSLSEFAAEYKKAADEIKPDCFLALQTIQSRYKINGETNENILRVLSNKNGTGIRAGACNYIEGNARAMLKKIFDVARDAQDCKRWDFVKQIAYEAENYPRIAMMKSPDAMLGECALALAAGCDSLSFFFHSSLNTDSQEIYDDFAKKCAEWKPYLKKIAEYSKDSQLCGIMRPIGKDAISTPRLHQQDRFATNRAMDDFMLPLMLNGIPICPENAVSCALLITTNAVNSMSDVELSKAMEHPLIIDANALEILKKRGFDFGVSATQMKSGGKEIFDGKSFSNLKKSVLLSVKSKDVKILSELAVDGKIGAALCIAKARNGKNVLIVGGLGIPEYQSHFRKKLFLDALEKIDAKLPARIDTAWRCAILPRIDANGKVCAVTVINLAVGRALPLKLRVQNPKSDNCVWQTVTTSTSIKSQQNPNGETIITLPPMGAWEVGTLFFE